MVWDPGGGPWPAALNPASPHLDSFPRTDGRETPCPAPLNGSRRQATEQGAGPAGQASPALTLNCVSEWVPTHASVAALAFAQLRLPTPSACTFRDSSACLATVSLAPGPASCMNLGDPRLSHTCPAREWRRGAQSGQTGLQGRSGGGTNWFGQEGWRTPPPSPVKDTGQPGECMLGAGALPRCLCFVI